jgi:hypothetical protein
MLDRLISGAGAITDLADRLARMFTRRGGQDILGRRPGSVLVAIGLAVLAGFLGLVGLEASDDPNPVAFDAGHLATSSELGNRTFATVEGALHGTYVETYLDENANETQDPGEQAEAWFYFLVDPATRAGLTVRSTRPPNDVFVLHATGQLVADPAYIEDDRSLLEAELAAEGVTLEPTLLLDTTVPPTGTVLAVGLDALPGDGATVSLSGTTVGYAGPSCADFQQDPDCSEAAASFYDVVIFDPASGRGIIVYTSTSPEFIPATFTGMLRRDERAVDDARTTPGLDFGELDLTVSDRFLLEDGATPASAPVSFAASAVSLLGATVIFVGLWGRYLVYHRRQTALPVAAPGIALGERIPVHVTGVLRSPGGDLHVREAAADLLRFATSEPPPTDTGPVAEPTSTLIVERRGKPEGVALGIGELHRLSVGSVIPFRGPRPALRAVAGTGPLLLSFDDDAARDRAAAALLDESGLFVSGAIASETPATTIDPDHEET